MDESNDLRTREADETKPLPPKGRFIINLAANLVNFGLGILVGLWLTPYIIHKLGVGVYGLVPLVTSLTSYLGLFTIALNAGLGRFITIAMERHDYKTANGIFNTSFWSSVAFLTVLLGPTLWLSSRAKLFFSVPSGYEDQFIILLLYAIAVFFLSTLDSVFGVASYCRNRFDLANLVAIVGTFVRAAAILLMFSFFVPKLSYLGLAMLIASTVSLALSIAVWKYLTPTLKLEPSAFNRNDLRQLTSMGGWLVINQLGTLLYLAIDLIVVNKMIGAEATGQYGVVMIWSANLRSLGGVVSNVFAPTIISLYAIQDKSELIAYSRRAVKFVGLMIALPIGILCGLAKPLLRIWLGAPFEPLALLMAVMTIHLCVNLAVLPMFSIQVAANRVRLPGILTCLMGLGNLGLALFLAGPAGWGMYGVALAGALMLTAKNLLFTPLYAAHILGIRSISFYKELLPIVCSTLMLAAAAYFLAQNLQINTWFALIATGTGLAAAFAVMTYCFLLTNEEQRHALSFFPFLRTSVLSNK